MSVQEPPARQRMLVSAHDAEALVQRRIVLGMDRYDEVWEGEYRMSPAPGSAHGRIEVMLSSFLLRVTESGSPGFVGHLNVRPPGTGNTNFRIPDISFIADARVPTILSEWGCEGAPDLAVEIRSPGDDTYLKIPFYGELGVRELLVIRGKSAWVELFRNVAGTLTSVIPPAEGWLRLETLPVEIRSVTKPDGAPGLEARDTRDGALSVQI